MRFTILFSVLLVVDAFVEISESAAEELAPFFGWTLLILLAMDILELFAKNNDNR